MAAADLVTVQHDRDFDINNINAGFILK